MKRITRAVLLASAGLALAAGGPARAASCDRAGLVATVDRLLASMIAHAPEQAPLAPVYTATENSHPAALGMMQAWRTITAAGKPALLALDAPAGAAYFALRVDENGGKSVLWGRIKVTGARIGEIELFINRARGDHGFSFGADQLPANYAALIAPPAGRARASHAELAKLAAASFDADDPLQVAIADDCQFAELGWKVVDPGLDDVPATPPPDLKPAETFDREKPLGCVFPPYRPTDKAARVIAIDDELGLVVVAGLVPGHVFPYPYYGHMLSAFIPDQMKTPADAQDAWFKRPVAHGKAPVVSPEPATGETMQVLQYYDGKLHASQINVYLSGPGARSVWVKP